MKILYSILSLIVAIGLIVGCTLIDLVISKDVILAGLGIIGKAELFNMLDFGKIFLVISIAFLCSFGIIVVLYIKNGKKHILSSLLASSVSIIFFTLYFRSFELVRNFYLVSEEFSKLVKITFNNIFTFNLIFSFAVILLVIISLICKVIIRRNKDEKEF